MKKAGHFVHGFGPPGLEAARLPTSELPGSAQRIAARWAERGAVPPRSSATWTIGAAGAGWLPPEREEARCGPGPGEEVPASLRARSPPTRPGPRVPAAGKEQEVWGRHTHANPAREAGRPHPGPPPLRLPRAPALGALPLRQPARARALIPKSAPRTAGGPRDLACFLDGCPPVPRCTSRLSTLGDPQIASPMAHARWSTPGTWPRSPCGNRTQLRAVLSLDARSSP